MNWYIKSLYDYLTFRGRSTRKEFWIFITFDICFLFFTTIVDHKFDLIYVTYDTRIGLLSFLYLWFTFMPRLTLTVRRLHDVGLNAGYLSLFLIPFVGHYILLKNFLKEGSTKGNEYGISPHTEEFRDHSAYFNTDSNYIID